MESTCMVLILVFSLEQIAICSNHLLTGTQGEVDQILTHELVHAYDHCRAANLDWSNCQHHACSEVCGRFLSSFAFRNVLRSFFNKR